MSQPKLTGLAAWFLLVYAGGVIYLSLFPFHFASRPGYPLFFWYALDSRRQVFDFLVNTLFYMPVGAAAWTALGATWKAGPAAIFVGGLLSLLIECAQYWDPGRYSTLNDIAANTAGTAVGVVAGSVLVSFGNRQLLGLFSSQNWRLSGITGLFLLEWTVWQAFPFFLTFKLPALRDALQQVTSLHWSWLLFVQTGFGFAMLAMVFGASRWLWLAFALLPLQVFLLDRGLSVPAILGALTGWLLGRASRRLESPGLIAAALILWLSVEEFRPFRFGSQKHPFNWMPLQNVLDRSSSGPYITLFGKLFLYTAVVWAIRRATRGFKFSWLLAVGIPIGVLALGEWAQQYLEGRTPESTDLILLAAGAGLLFAVRRRSAAMHRP